MHENARTDNAEASSLDLGNFLPGAQIAGRYTVQRVISADLCAVYAATENDTDRHIALKIIPNISQFKSARNHTNAIRTIGHRNLVQIYDAGTCDGFFYLAMELIEGQSLRTYLDSFGASGKNIPVPIAARIISEVLIGLEAAHARGITDIDLKPTRVILTSDPTVEAANLKITDLGATARALGSRDPSRNLRYAAPEIVSGRLCGNPASDLYSVSVLFYEMLMHTYPHGEWRSPTLARDDVPEYIGDLIFFGLNQQITRRPQSANEYLSGLVRPRGQARSGDSIASRISRIFRRR